MERILVAIQAVQCRLIGGCLFIHGHVRLSLRRFDDRLHLLLVGHLRAVKPATADQEQRELIVANFVPLFVERVRFHDDQRAGTFVQDIDDASLASQHAAVRNWIEEFQILFAVQHLGSVELDVVLFEARVDQVCVKQRTYGVIRTI